MRLNPYLTLLVMVACAAPSALAAQTVAPPRGQVDPCQPSGKAPPGGSQQDACHSSGVIQPPATGDRGVVKPPETGSAMPMPVIPPPGSPGGNQSVQPK